jgi:hypothetical protein
MLVVLLIVVFGGLLAFLTLRQQEPEPEPSPSPTPVVVGSFELEGTITAASTASLVSPRTGSRSVDSGVTGTIDIRLDEIRGDFDGCEFEAGEAAIVRIVEATVFDPPTLISNSSFPDNLTGEDVQATGQVLQDPDDECHLIAERIEDTPDATTGTGGGRSPSPRVTSSPSLSPRPTGGPTNSP